MKVSFKITIQSILFLLILATLCNCKSSVEQKSEYEIKWDKINQKTKEIRAEITKEYNIQYTWDTLAFDYTVQYEKVLKSEYQLIHVPVINDIYFQNGEYIISVFIYGSRHRGNFYFELIVPEHLVQKTDFIKLGDKRNARFFFVVKIKQIKKYEFEVKSILEENDSRVRIDVSDAFHGTGELIEIFEQNID